MYVGENSFFKMRNDNRFWFAAKIETYFILEWIIDPDIKNGVFKIVFRPPALL